MSNDPHLRLYRTVVLADDAKDYVDEQIRCHPRFDQQWDGIVWKLARIPERAPDSVVVGDKEYLVNNFVGVPLTDMCDVVVLYSYDEEKVTVHAVLHNVKNK